MNIVIVNFDMCSIDDKKKKFFFSEFHYHRKNPQKEKYEERKKNIKFKVCYHERKYQSSVELNFHTIFKPFLIK